MHLQTKIDTKSQRERGERKQQGKKGNENKDEEPCSRLQDRNDAGKMAAFTIADSKDGDSASNQSLQLVIVRRCWASEQSAE